MMEDRDALDMSRVKTGQDKSEYGPRQEAAWNVRLVPLNVIGAHGRLESSA